MERCHRDLSERMVPDTFIFSHLYLFLKFQVAFLVIVNMLKK